MTTGAEAPARLVDTNVLVAATDTARAHAAASVAFLERASDLVIASQVVREYLAVCTRPPANNGLGMNPEAALGNVRAFRRIARTLPDDREVLPIFLDLVREFRVSGRRTHDAWLVATAIAHGIGAVATWNTADYAGFGARIRVITPDAG